jgi:hypothetical protein
MRVTLSLAVTVFIPALLMSGTNICSAPEKTVTSFTHQTGFIENKG